MSTDKVIAVIGSATVGSEVARLAAEAGATVLVLEAGPRPYGELESLLPAWQAATLGGFVGRIDQNLAHPDIVFVPRTALDRDVSRATLEAMGVVVVPATGRKHRVETPWPGRDVLSHRELIGWFNRRGHPAYPGPELELPREVVVVGDHVLAVEATRIVSYEVCRQALMERGHSVGISTLARDGVAATLARLGVKDLGIAVSLVVPGGLETLLDEAPNDLRGAVIENLKTRDLVTVWPGFDVELHSRMEEPTDEDHRLSTVHLHNARGEGFRMAVRAGLLVDARTHLGPSDTLEVWDQLEPALTHKLWESRLIPARNDEAAIARGAALSEALGTNIRELVSPIVQGALTPRPAGTRERALQWARSRHAEIGYSDYGDWLGESRRRWLY